MTPPLKRRIDFLRTADSRMRLIYPFHMPERRTGEITSARQCTISPEAIDCGVEASHGSVENLHINFSEHKVHQLGS